MGTALGVRPGGVPDADIGVEIATSGVATRTHAAVQEHCAQSADMGSPDPSEDEEL